MRACEEQRGVGRGFSAGSLDRRDFLRICGMSLASIGLSYDKLGAVMQALESGRRPSVIWLSLMECTGCTESLLRATHPALEELILSVVSMDYHETLFAAAGLQIEEARAEAMQRNAGRYILVVEGSVPTRDNGIYCRIGGQTALELVRECAEGAGAVIALGSCASWGGVAAAQPNPTGARGIPAVLPDRNIVTIPGCPPNPYNFLGVVLQYATWGTLPELDEQGRPLFAYARTIHEDCARRPHFDAGRFATAFGDEGHRQGWCLYQLGCKGPQTHSNCGIKSFNEVTDAWPVGIGHPCVGCTEPAMIFRLPISTTVDIPSPTPSALHTAVTGGNGGVSPAATGVAGLVVGGLAGAGLTMARRLSRESAAPAAAGDGDIEKLGNGEAAP